LVFEDAPDSPQPTVRRDEPLVSDAPAVVGRQGLRHRCASFLGAERSLNIVDSRAFVNLAEARGPQPRLPELDLAQAPFRELPSALENATTLEDVKAVVSGLTDVVGLLVQSAIAERDERSASDERRSAASIRKVIYTRNAIESLNMTLRKVIKTRASFPNEEAATRLLYLALLNVAKEVELGAELARSAEPVPHHVAGAHAGRRPLLRPQGSRLTGARCRLPHQGLHVHACGGAVVLHRHDQAARSRTTAGSTTTLEAVEVRLTRTEFTQIC
jgi:hypothetical protein